MESPDSEPARALHGFGKIFSCCSGSSSVPRMLRMSSGKQEGKVGTPESSGLGVIRVIFTAGLNPSVWDSSGNPYGKCWLCWSPGPNDSWGFGFVPCGSAGVKTS